MNRFVILLHKLGTDAESNFANEHWDVMLEVDVEGCGQLDTWSIPPIKIESDNFGCKLNSFSCPAKKLPYHRLAYLDYEGDVSNNRGNVKRIDRGTYQKINENKFKLSGELFDGELTILNDQNKYGNSCEIIFVSFNADTVF
jgi:hypothetical protein